ncbi:MAG: c-type cytochrome [Betaproteobacteria bacterium]
MLKLRFKMTKSYCSFCDEHDPNRHSASDRFGTASFGLTGRASAQNDDVRKGHFLAAHICAICHVAAADQAYPPIMKPPASSFASIAQRMDAEPLKNFMATTHRGLNNPKGMPNPQLMDYQIKQLVAYILSLRK